MSIPLFPERPKQTPIVPIKDPYANVLHPTVLRMMIRDFLLHWDAIYPAVTICHYPDDDGSLSVWDTNFGGRHDP